MITTKTDEGLRKVIASTRYPEAARAAAKDELDAREAVTTEYRILSVLDFLAWSTGSQFASVLVLRQALADVPRAELDAELIRLFVAQDINLIPQSNQQALTNAERAAAVECGGEDKTLVALAG